jgi:hypothetical protein
MQCAALTHTSVMIIVQSPFDLILARVGLLLNEHGMGNKRLVLSSIQRLFAGVLSTLWAWYSIAITPLLGEPEIGLADAFLTIVTVIKTLCSMCFYFSLGLLVLKKKDSRVSDSDQTSVGLTER